jgi:tetratricopeptide (TPR) repeat protein/tRNA A-37 threonylcarbamoyl transferase component Bud32
MSRPAEIPLPSTVEPKAAAADLTCEVDLPDGPVDAVPDRVAGLRLQGQIARGGMGTVYLAHDEALHRQVAVKVLQPRLLGHPAAAARFLEEAQITAQLQHPGVPPVHLVGTLPDGRPFLAMKLIRGQTLAALLADGAGDPGRVLGIFEQVCNTVAYAHDHGVIHRDLKPQNVMVGRFNEVQVMDWGLAKVRTAAPPGLPESAETSAFHDPRDGSDDFETRAGSVLGTPAYMAPEQAIGAVDKLDERSDVFGLGAILCVALTGQPPYVAPDPEAVRRLAAAARQEETNARLSVSGADPELVALCRRCLSADPAARPANAGEVARTVAELRAAADERARAAEVDRVRAEVAAREQRERRRAHLAATAAVGVLLAGAGTVAWLLDSRGRDDRARQERNGDALSELVDRGEAALRDGNADRAEAAIGQIDLRLADGGGDGLAGRVGRCRRDLALLRELDAIDADRWSPLDARSEDVGVVVRAWRASLLGYGLDVAGAPPEAGGAVVDGSLLRDRLLAVLDLWLVWEPSAAVHALVRRCDADPFRDALRDAVLTQDRGRQVGLAADPRALDQPPRFAAAAGRLPTVDVARRRAVLEAGVRKRPGDMELLMALGKTYPIDERDGAGARVRWYQAAVAARPGNVIAVNDLGLALFELNDLAAAAASFRDAIRLDPNWVWPHNNFGLVLRDRNELPAAEAEFREAIRLAPGLARPHNNLGIALRRLNDIPGAEAEFREAIRLDPKFAQPHNELGLLRREGNDPAGAAAEFREAIRLDPKFAWPHNNLGIVLRDLNDIPRAVAEFREAVMLYPNALAPRENLAFALLAHGDPDAAALEFYEVNRLEPQRAGRHMERGRSLLARERPAAAAAEFRAAARLDPWLAGAHNSLGLALTEVGDLRGAAAAFREAVRFDPGHHEAHDHLAWLLAAGPDWVRDGRRAIEHATRACELTGWNNPYYIYALGVAHAAAGDFDRAAEVQRRALAFTGFGQHFEQEGRHLLELYRQKKAFYDSRLNSVERGPPPRPVD